MQNIIKQLDQIDRLIFNEKVMWSEDDNDCFLASFNQYQKSGVFKENTDEFWYFIMKLPKDDISKVSDWLYRLKHLGFIYYAFNTAVSENEEDIAELIYRYVNRDEKDNFGMTPLMRAIEDENKDMIHFLLNNLQVNVNIKDNDGMTPLLFAIKNGLKDIVHLILNNHKVRVHTLDNNGMTPLLYAIKNGNTEIVRFILDTHGVDVNRKDKNGMTPLMYAIRRGNKDIVHLLRNNLQVNVNIKDDDGMTPLLFAIQYEQYKPGMFRLLLEFPEVDVNISDNRGITPLLSAIKHGHPDIALYLINTPTVNVNTADRYGMTPLYYAVRYGMEVIVNVLMETRYIEVDKQNISGDTPLHIAISTFNWNIFRVLISKADVNIKNSKQNTPLHTAALLCGQKKPISLGLISELIANGAELHAQNEGGMTPLHLAIQKQNLLVVDQLIKAGAPLEYIDRHGDTPLETAIHKNNTKIAELLIANNANVNTQNPNDGHSLLHTAVTYNVHVDIFRLLLKNHAHPNARDYMRRTPLELLIRQRNLDKDYLIAEMLLFFNCDTSFVTVQVLQRMNENMKDTFKKHYIRLLKPSFVHLPYDAFKMTTAQIIPKDVYDDLGIEYALRHNGNEIQQ